MSFNTIRISFLALAGVVLTTFSLSVYAANQVTTDWLAKNADAPDVVLIDMNDGSQYQRFHIRNAINLPYDAINVRNKQQVSFSAGEEQLVRILGFLGVKQDSHIVIYDDTAGLNAGRLYWELERLGHPRVSIVEGGLVKWILEGRPVTQAIPKPVKTTYTPARKNPMDNLASLQDITNLPKGTVLLDVRSEEEYTGNPRFPRSGHIPGARWWPWDESVNFEQGFTLKEEKTLRAGLEKLGVSSTDTPVMLYCRSGHRAAQSYYTLRSLGFKNIKLYDGSMSEYSKHKELPLKMGTQP